MRGHRIEWAVREAGVGVHHVELLGVRERGGQGSTAEYFAIDNFLAVLSDEMLSDSATPGVRVQIQWH
jgi:hypothetical protein